MVQQGGERNGSANTYAGCWRSAAPSNLVVQNLLPQPRHQACRPDKNARCMKRLQLGP